MKDRFFTTFWDTYLGHTFRLFAHFTYKMTQKMAFEKRPEVRIKQDKKLKD
jgi:hypothetical protein